MSKVSKIMEDVCEELNLKITPDWGIINSDASRVKEFIEYVTDRKSFLPFSMQYEILELILASMNDAILEDIADCVIHSKFYEYIKPILNDNKYYPHIPYWMSIKSKDEFPVGFLLEKYIEEDEKRNL